MRPDWLVHGNLLYRAGLFKTPGHAVKGNHLSLDVPHLWLCRRFSSPGRVIQKSTCMAEGSCLYVHDFFHGIRVRQASYQARFMSMELQTLPLEYPAGCPAGLCPVLVFSRPDLRIRTEKGSFFLIRSFLIRLVHILGTDIQHIHGSSLHSCLFGFF